MSASRSTTVVSAALLSAAALVVAGCTGGTEPSGGSGTTAGNYPQREVEFVVPAAPGGASDLFARTLSTALERTGVDVRVVNKAGGDTVTGTMEVVQSSPDGYKWVISNNVNTINVHIVQENPPFGLDDLTLGPRGVTTPIVFVVGRNSSYNTMREVVDAVKKDPGAFSYGSAGPAAPSSISVAQILTAEGVDPKLPKLVVFNGGGPVITAVVGGHVSFAAQNMSEVVQMVRAGELKALAIAAPERSPILPDVPTAAEAGVPAFQLSGAFGLAGPAGVDAGIVDYWNKTFERLQQDKAFTDELVKNGNVPAYLSAKDYQAWTSDLAQSTRQLLTALDLAK